MSLGRRHETISLAGFRRRVKLGHSSRELVRRRKCVEGHCGVFELMRGFEMAFELICSQDWLDTVIYRDWFQERGDIPGRMKLFVQPGYLHLCLRSPCARIDVSKGI